MNEVGNVIVSLWQKYAPGAALTSVLAGTAGLLAARYGAPAMLMGLLLGMAFHFMSEESTRLHLGLELMAGPALRVGVALLGVRLAFTDLAQLGWEPILFLMCAVLLTIAAGMLGSRLLGVERSVGVLTGGSVAICGASAAMAIAAVLPASAEKQRATLFTVMGVASFSTVAMIFYPLLGEWLQLEEQAMGFFIGATIHDVAQVVGAGYSVSEEAGDLAVMVKLFRVAMLVPVVALIAFLVSRNGSSSATRSRLPAVPLFLLGFLVFFGANTAGFLPPALANLLSNAASILLLLAITALGLRTSLREVLTIGLRPVVLLLGETVFLAVLVLGFIFW